MLLERESELASIDRAIASATDGAGAAVVVEGQAGIGKSALLDEVRRRAADAGLTVLSAQGAPLEQDFGFGVVRQVYEPVLRRATDGQRHALLDGAAAPAARAVLPEGNETTASDQVAVLHGLYWLTEALTQRGAVLVAVDDVQWADVASLRFLAHLGRRLDGLPILLAVALRTGDAAPDPAALAELAAGPGVRALRPEPLSTAGIAQLVATTLGEPADAGFVAACRAATGGVPYLVQELAGALRIDRVPPVAAAIDRIAAIGPRTIANATMLRLSRVPVPAGDVARATAVWGPHVRLDRVAALAGIARDEVQTATDALIDMGILAAGPPAGFAHPLVRQAIYDDMSAASRAAAHGRAAEILAAGQAPVEEIAAHLLLSEPMGRADVVATLRLAARRSVAGGAPQSAVAYLRRAHAEGVTDADRAALLLDLGRAEALAQDLGAVAHFEQALESIQTPVERARALYELSEVHLLAGRWSLRLDLLREVLDVLGDADPDFEARVHTALSGSEFYDPARVSAAEAREPRLHALVDRGMPGSRALAVTLGAVGAFRGRDRAQVLALVGRGLDGGGLLRDEGPESLALPQVMAALIALDEPAPAARATEGVLAAARRRGSVGGFVAGSLYVLAVEAHCGRLKEAEAHLRTTVELALTHGLTFVLPGVVSFGIDVLLERPDLSDIATLLSSIELDPDLASTVSGAWLAALRGRLLAQQGEPDRAASDLRAAGRIFDGLRFRNPILTRWRSPLALALPAEQADEARALVAAELADATAAGLARARGVALRAAGCLAGGERGIPLLEQSLAELAGDNAVLERARTLVDLGRVLRQANQRVAARGPLSEGLDLARRCGAERLAARATEELLATGARPRRAAVSGPDALTAAESRVAQLAADGMSNREIAQSLFVTAKTVENQLGSVYRKLGVRSRGELGSALLPAG